MTARERSRVGVRRRSWRGWCVLGLVFVLLGAATNVLVAWGMVVWYSQQSDPDQPMRAWTSPQQAIVVHANYRVQCTVTQNGAIEHWLVDGLDQPDRAGIEARERASRVGGVGAIRIGPLGGDLESDRRAIELASGPLPTWIDHRQPSERLLIGMRVRSGWPLQSMIGRSLGELMQRGERLEDRAYMNEFLTVPDWSAVPGWLQDLELPARPHLPGFVVNTLVYALAWLCVMWTGGTAVRAWRRGCRRSRGRCGRCGYALAGLEAAHSGTRSAGGVCPECGESIPPSNR